MTTNRELEGILGENPPPNDPFFFVVVILIAIAWAVAIHWCAALFD